MGILLVSLAQILEIPSKNMILLVGSPGSGKSSFCQQSVFSNIEMRPVIYVATESVGVESVRAVLFEDAMFPSSRARLIEQSGLETGGPTR